MAALFGKFKEVLGFQDPLDSIDEEYSEFDGSDYRNLYEDENVRDDYSDSLPSRRRRTVASHDAPPADFKGRSSRERSYGQVSAPGTSGKVIGLPGVQNLQGEVVLLHPKSFGEMAEVIKHLRDRKSVVMNLTLMDAADAQRSVDFVAGGTYAIDGHQERIGENIFLFTPNCVSVTTNSTDSETDAPAAPETQHVQPEHVEASPWRKVVNG